LDLSWDVSVKIKIRPLNLKFNNCFQKESYKIKTLFNIFICRSGCWGVKISLFRSRIIEVAERMLTISHFQEYDYDQILLDQFIWPIAKDNAVITLDIFSCKCVHSYRRHKKCETAPLHTTL
jgi:hypothetical protein